MAALPVQAAISLDRTRVIFDGTRTSTSLTISNQNKTLPYLAQAWVDRQRIPGNRSKTDRLVCGRHVQLAGALKKQAVYMQFAMLAIDVPVINGIGGGRLRQYATDQYCQHAKR